MSTASVEKLRRRQSEDNRALVSLLSQPAPGLMVSGWLLWTAVFWENYVNLNFNAPYTESYLSAPIMIAALKTGMLAAVGLSVDWTRTRTARLHDASAPAQPFVTSLMTCWFLSAAVWTLYLVWRDWKFRPSAADALYASADPLAIFLFSHLQAWPGPAAFIWTYAGESLIFLCLGWAVSAALTSLRGRSDPNTDRAGTSRPSMTMAEAATAVLAYSALNGVFAYLIRV